MQDRNKDNQQEGSAEKQQTGNDGSNLVGRIDQTENSELQEKNKTSDISEVDRQEGAMDNGELGGNFSQAGKKA